MEVKFKGHDGVSIYLSGEDVATAVNDWLEVHGVNIKGTRITKVNGYVCESGEIFILPSGTVSVFIGG